MNIDTRARDAATSLRATAPADVEGGLRRMHRTRQRRTAGKAIAAVVVVALGVGAVQIERDRKRALDPVSRSDRWVLVTSGYANDWSVPLAKQGVQTYPRFTSADPATRRFLVINEEGTRLHVMTPGRDEPIVTIRCGDGCAGIAALGPGADEITMLNSNLHLVVVRYDGSFVRDLGPTLQRAEPVVGFVQDIAWSPDRTTWAEARLERRVGARVEQRIANVSVSVVLRRPGSTHATTLYSHAEAAPPHLDAVYVAQWPGPALVDLQWAPNSTRVAFMTLTSRPTSRQRSPDEQAYQMRLFVADTETGKVDQIADLGSCYRAADHPNCDSRSPSLAWAPDGQSLTVLTNTALSRYDLTGKVLQSESPRVQGPLAWIESK